MFAGWPRYDNQQSAFANNALARAGAHTMRGDNQSRKVVGYRGMGRRGINRVYRCTGGEYVGTGEMQQGMQYQP